MLVFIEPVPLLSIVDHRRRRWSIRTRLDSSQRRCLEKCSQHRLTDILDSETESCKVPASVPIDLVLSCQMLGLMNEVSDVYNQRLLEYADKQEIFDCKLYVSLLKDLLPLLVQT
jgi:hypothetical protein